MRAAPAAGHRRLRDRAMALLVAMGAAIALLPLFLVLGYVVREGIGALNLAFFIRDPAPVGEPGGGVRNAIVGSLVINLMASLIGVTIGVGGGIFLSEYGQHRLAPMVRLVGDVLGGMPAIIMGLVAYELVVRPMRSFSALAGAVALGLLMIPIVIRATESALGMVPRELREAGMALGLPRWRVTVSVVLPAARYGIVTGALLALARVAGEAAPLLLTAFGNPYLSLDPTRPMDSLPLRVFVYAISPFREWHAQAWAASLVLVLLILSATLAARWMTRQRA
ncbi:phosphate ABC transporter permease PstA [Geochorda subterranea]|uniref:Phosphate transport system permease protein PstA n=1 Tax=Geochorda subterranea TaxID=3109564 RepID=A0ABZ1BRS0_9FIRM|nr:phosphate ABC transporter permease PstA [Limnochorda sp. LNt]WRP15507.1 phosphate ABC transporter permease PstA [Limnochorda sp. LNt]